MATTAVAASAAVLKPVIAKLSSDVWKNLSMFWGLEKECDNVKNMLITISTVLTDAEKKSITDGLIRRWLLQLQDVAYDIDDLLDDLQIEAQRRNKNKSPIRAIQDFFSSDNQVKFRVNMVKKIMKITERLRKIMKEKNSFELVEGNVLIEEDNTERETISAVNEHEVYGRNEEKEILINLLIDGSTHKDVLSVLPLVGMAGVGKTTLAQIVCRDPIIKKHFDPIIWVHVPMKFELINILHKLLECVSGKNCDVLGMEAMQNKVGTMISGTKFLLVLDDVWNEDATKWEKLKTVLTCGMVGSKVLVTTRNEKIAKIMGTIDHFRVNPLEFQYCWELFKERAFRSARENEDANLVNIGKEIVSKCKGLPLAAKHLGNLAGYREVDWSLIRDNDIWQMEECGGGIVKSLFLSYIYLPSNLKRCFAYCSLFPKGYMFKKEFLIQLWTCEGFIPKMKRGTHLENAANLCFDYLLSRSFFEESERTIGDSRIYTMHDLIHDLACYVAGNKFFLRSEGEYSQKVVSWRYSSVCFNDVIVVRKLRSLLLLNGYKNLGTKLDSIMQLQFLRVLDISGSHIKVLPCTIGDLRHLRYLNASSNNFNTLPNSVSALLSLEVLDLSWCEQLKMIPVNLGALQKLEVLDLSGCLAIKNLPISLCSLTELRILDLTYCKSLISIPKGIGNLTKLERLPFLIIGEEEGCTIGELRQLNLLKHDLQIVVGEDWGLHDISNSNLGAKQHLKSIKLKENVRASNAKSIIKFGSKPIGSIQLP